MTKNLNDQNYFNQLLESRKISTFARKIFPLESSNSLTKNDILMWMFESDLGVRLNRGKWGSSDGPKVLLHHFSSMVLSSEFEKIVPQIFSCAVKKISEPLDQFIPDIDYFKASIIQLGGGHDNVYHLLKLAYMNGIKNYYIINIDAHADLRMDNLLHSGTPFRFFYNQNKKNIKTFHLEQWGLNKFSQNPDDLILDGAIVNSIWFENCTKANIFIKIEKLKEIISKNFNRNDSLLLISLDVDVLNSSQVKAVSAVNPQGFMVQHLKVILSKIYNEFKSYDPHLGVYEYNPYFDDINACSAKAVSSLIYHWIVGCHSKSS